MNIIIILTGITIKRVLVINNAVLCHSAACFYFTLLMTISWLSKNKDNRSKLLRFFKKQRKSKTKLNLFRHCCYLSRKTGRVFGQRRSVLRSLDVCTMQAKKSPTLWRLVVAAETFIKANGGLLLINDTLTAPGGDLELQIKLDKEVTCIKQLSGLATASFASVMLIMAVARRCWKDIQVMWLPCACCKMVG